MKKIIISIISVLTLVACQHNGQPSNEYNASVKADSKTVSAKLKQASDNENNTMDENILHLKGHIRYQTMEGGFYGFVAEDGSKYTLSKLPKTYLRNGLMIEIKAKPLLDVMTTTQFGSTIEVLDVKILDESGVKSHPTEQ